MDEYIESIGADGRKYVIGILLELSIICMTFINDNYLS